ncbi:hypothetical protein PENSPDRAFT_355786, partial [Peniophora sp. CONT]
MATLEPEDTSTPTDVTLTPPTRPSPSQNMLGSLWSQALQNYERRTGLDPRVHALTRDMAGCGSLEEILEQFDAKMKEFKRFRAGDPKWEKLRNRYLKPAVKVILVLNEALKEVSESFPGGNIIFVAFGALLTATNGVSKRYDALTDLFEEISLFIDNARIQGSNPRNWGSASRNIAVAIFVHLLDVFALALKLMKVAFGGTVFARLAHYGKSLAGEADMQDALARLRRLSELQSRALITETRVDTAENLAVTNTLLGNLVAMELAYSSYFKDIVGLLQDEHRRAAEERARAEQERQRAEAERKKADEERDRAAQERANAMLNRLERLDIADLSAQDRPGCLNETRVELLASLSAWSRDPSAHPIYWLNGMAGTGKSAIARSFGRQLDHDGILGGSFFCSREGAVDLTDAKRILPTLAAAWAGRDDIYKGALIETLRKYSDKARPSAWKLKDQVRYLLIEPFSLVADYGPPRFVLLVDGLDETSGETISELLSAVNTVSYHVPVKVFLASRPEFHIQRSLDYVRCVMRLQDIDEAAVRDDIRHYISYRMRKIVESFASTHLPETWPAEADMQLLADHAGSLFIYAFTATEYIAGGNPIKRMNDVLNVGHESMGQANPLDNLYRMYAFILSLVRGTEDETCLTWRILSTMYVVRENMDMCTLGRLLGTEVYELRIALRHLHAVIHVPERDDAGLPSTFHASFQDFLFKSNRVPKSVSVSKETGNLSLFSGCIAIMSSDDLHFNMSEA